MRVLWIILPCIEVMILFFFLVIVKALALMVPVVVEVVVSAEAVIEALAFVYDESAENYSEALEMPMKLRE